MTCDPLNKKDDDMESKKKDVDQVGNYPEKTGENSISLASRTIIHPNQILGIKLASYIPIGASK